VLLELFPYLSALLIEEVERRADKVVLRTRVRAKSGTCRCGQSSARVHGRYVRKLRDVAVGGLGVVIELHIRRFRCENTASTAVTFAEQVDTTPLPPPPSQPRRAVRRVGADGTFVVARHKLRPGIAHAGKTVTVVIEETCFRVLDGEVEISTHPVKGGPVTRYIADPR
jgi:hypothetical protein